MNRLKDEASPYLRLHADNPIDWYPWSREAIQKAKEENKPIFLSIGYSTCHWCHVMNKESFSDQEIAVILNKYFISIKVDREQHPDVDKVYMDYCLSLTGSGGWPLNLFLTPDLKPFFAGTYFPKQTSMRQIGFFPLLERLAKLWAREKETLIDHSEEITHGLINTYPVSDFNKELVNETQESLRQRYDIEYGGFLPAPKFPQLQNLIFLLSQSYLRRDKRPLSLAENTLKSLVSGGCYDQVSGGLFRYSTDRAFRIPHFEKMLYDNAFLIYVLAEFFKATKNSFYRTKCLEVFDFVQASFKANRGGYYTALDADDQEGEGAYYLFSYSELTTILTEDELKLLEHFYAITKKGNFQGKNHLYPQMKEALEEICQNPELESKFFEIFKKLHNYRQVNRKLPFKDEKILVFANGLLLAGLSKAASCFEDREINEAAHSLYSFLKETMKLENLPGAILEGPISQGHLNDYAFLAWGFLEYGLAFFCKEAIEYATILTQSVLEIFADEENGGFYSITKETVLPYRPKSYLEGALPEGNSVMSLMLFRQWQLSGEEKYRKHLEKMLHEAAGVLKKYPDGAPFLTMVGSWYLENSTEIVLSCPIDAYEKIEEIISIVQKNYIGQNLFWVMNSKGKRLGIEENKVSNGLKLFVCSGGACREALSDKNQILDLLTQII